MNDLPRQILFEIIRQYDVSLCDDPRRCEGLLRDLCGEHRREIFVLVSALEEGVASSLLGSQANVPQEVLLARLTKRLMDDLALEKDAARWAVESWALALGVIGEQEITEVRSMPGLEEPDREAESVEVIKGGRIFKSEWKLQVLVRFQRRADPEWEEIGRTPGIVHIPPDHEVGIMLDDDMDGASLLNLVKELTDSGIVRALFLGFGFNTNDVKMSCLRHFPELAELTISSCKELTDAGLAHLRGLPNLVHLDLQHMWGKINDAGLAHLRDLSNLTFLRLNGFEYISDAGLMHLRSLPNLTHVELEPWFNDEFTGAGLMHLRNLPYLTHLKLKDVNDLSSLRNLENLTHLELGWVKQLALLRNLHNLTHLTLYLSQTSDDQFKSLSDLHNLVHLDLGLEFVTGVGLRHLKNLQKLDFLRVYEFGEDCTFSDIGIEHLSDFPSLSHLELSGLNNVTNNGLAHLSSLSNLRHLELYRMDSITDAGLAHLSSLSNLTCLQLYYIDNITDTGLAYLSNLHNLTNLVISGGKGITGDGLVQLSLLPKLTHLSLFEIRQITKARLAHLSSLTNLTSLFLGEMGRITNAGLAPLCELTHLTHLRLYDLSRVTHKGVAQLIDLPHLDTLEIWNCENITQEGLARLERPGLSIDVK